MKTRLHHESQLKARELQGDGLDALVDVEVLRFNLPVAHPGPQVEMRHAAEDLLEDLRP